MRTRRRGMAVCGLAWALMVGACSGTSTTAGPPTGSSPATAAASPTGTGAGSPSPSGALAFDAVPPPSARAEDHSAAAARFDTAILAGIFDLAGIDDELGADKDALVAAAGAVARTEIARAATGDGATATGPVPPEPALRPASYRQQTGPSAPNGATRAVAPGVASLLLALFTTSDAGGPPGKATVDRGRLKGEVKVTLPPVSSGKWTMVTMRLTVKLDLGVCPDAAGQAKGTIELHSELEVGGGPQVMRGRSDVTIAVSLRADGDALLAETDAELTGDISGTEGSTTESATFTGAGLTLSGPSTNPNPSNVRGQMHPGTLSQSNIQPVQEAVVHAAMLGGLLAGRIASDHWSSGKCLELAFTPPSPYELAAGARPIEVETRAKSTVDGADVHGKVTATKLAGDGTVDPSGQAMPDPGPFTVTPAPDGRTIDVGVEMRSKRGVGYGTWKGWSPSYRVDVNLSGMTITGEKCDGVEGAWHLVVGGRVSGGGMSIDLSGSIDAQIDADGRGTYTVRISVSGAGLPPSVLASLAIDGGGTARVDESAAAPTLELLDGTLSGTASGSGGGASIVDGLPKSPAGTTAIPLIAGC